jgi:N-methylhydantoinase B
MIACSSDLSKMVMTPSGLSTVALTIINAKNRSGARFISSITDPGAIGAFSFRDGVDFGGFVFNPRSRMAASVEVWEEHSDMLMLYRKANEGGGGHGRWRGGTSTTYAITRHKAQHLEASNFGLAPSIPTAQGLFGGYLGGGGKYYFAFESGLREALAQGSLPADGTELRITAPNGRRVQAKEVGVEFGRDSIWEITHCTTPGYGDPLRRSPLLVAKDVANHAVTAEVAGNIYGTVLKVDGTLDAEQTRQLRAKLRLERLAKCTMPRSECSMQDQAEMPVVLNVGDTLVVLKGTEHYVFGCAHCAAPIGPVSKNYKDFAATLDLQLTQIEPGRFEDPHSDTEASLVYRQYLCASCGSLLHNDLCQPDDRSVWDMELDVASLGRTDKLPSTPPVSRAARADILS